LRLNSRLLLKFRRKWNKLFNKKPRERLKLNKRLKLPKPNQDQSLLNLNVNTLRLKRVSKRWRRKSNKAASTASFYKRRFSKEKLKSLKDSTQSRQ
jgi:hypothetical protein